MDTQIIGLQSNLDLPDLDLPNMYLPDDNFDDFDNLDDNTIKYLIYNNKLSDYSKLLKYIKKGVDEEIPSQIENMGFYYEHIEKKQDLSIECYIKFLNLTNNFRVISKIIEYYEENYDYEQVVKYINIGIANSNTYSMIHMGKFYFDAEEYDNMKKLYDLAEKMGDSDVHFYYSIYYLKIGDIENMIKHTVKGIEREDSLCLMVICKYYQSTGENPLKLYNILLGIKNSSMLANKHIEQMELNPIVIKYKSKLIEVESNPRIKNCIVCYEDKSHVKFDCGHEICIGCYCLISQCYYKCSDCKNNDLICDNTGINYNL